MDLENDEMDRVLNDSAKELNDHVQEKIEKKKRGPKGPRTDKPKEKLSSMESNAQAVKISREQYAQMIGGMLMVSGIYLAKATKFKGFEMQLEEIGEVSLQGAIVCELCMPTVDPKTLAIGGFTFGIASLYGMKYMAYKEHLKQVELAKKQVQPTEEKKV